MPRQTSPTAIALKVKVPPGHLSSSSDSDSFDLGSISVNSTIGNVRLQIQQLVPSHPAPERQRLLYGGRALVDNEQTIVDALNTRRDPAQNEYVIHLLVKGEHGMASSGVGAGTGVGHRRVGSAPPPSVSPTPNVNGAQQQQPSTTQQPPGPPHVPQHHILQHQQNVARQMQMQQQMMFQIAQAQPRGAMMPPFMPPPHGQPMGAMQIPPGMQLPPHMRAAPGGQALPGVDGQQEQQQPVTAQMNALPGQADADGQQQQQQQSADTTQAQAPNLPTGTANQQQHAPRRPISQQGFHMEGIGANGERFQIHQQTLNIPHMGMPGQAMSFGMPPMMQQPGFMMPQMPFPPPGMGVPRQQNGPSALDRARENMVEMRRMLDEMSNQPNATEEQQRRVGEVMERAQNLNQYIDPLQLGNAGQNNATGRRSTSPRPPAPGQNVQTPGYPQALRVPRSQMPPHLQHTMPQQLQQPSNPNDVTTYLLSSPQGPQALLFSPQHGAYTGSLTPAIPTTTLRPTPTTQPQPVDPVAEAARQHLAAAAAAQVANPRQPRNPEDPQAAVQPIVGHLWWLLRVLIFAYFLLGADLGSTRPLLLLGVGLAFWMIRAGMLGDGVAGGVRRWWEGVVGVPRARQARAPQGEEGRAQDQAQGGQDGAARGQQGARQPMPTPEQVAQRLLAEEDARRDQRRTWLRERVRPVERAVALFVASLWPGVGEAHVRAQREEEARRLSEAQEEEVAAAGRRREEEEREKNEGGEKGKNEAGEKGEGEKVEGEKVEGEKVEGEKGEVGGGEVRDGDGKGGGENAVTSSATAEGST